MAIQSIHIFIAHAKSDDHQATEDLRYRIGEVFKAEAIKRGQSIAISMTLGREDFETHFKRCGSWDAWAMDIVTRVDYATRQPVYSAVVIPNRIIGKATAQIGLACIARGSPLCLFFDRETGSLQRIREIRTTLNANDYKSGWEIVT